MERNLNSAPENLSAMNTEESQSSPWRNPELEQAMEEIYHPPSTRFSLADFHDGKENVERKHRYDENDYQLHRMESFHHHQPLRRLHHHRHRAYSRSDQEETEFDDDFIKPEEKTEDVNTGVKPKVEESLSPAKKVETEPTKDSGNEKVQFFLGSVTSLEHQTDDSKNSPLIIPGRKLSAPTVPSVGPTLRSSLKKPMSKEGKKDLKGVSFTDNSHLLEENEGESSYYIGDSSVTEPLLTDSKAYNANQSKVTFQLGEENVKQVKDVDDDSNQKPLSKKSDHYHHHHHHRKHRHRHEPLQRLQSGSNLEHDKFSSHQIIEPEEAAMLQTADLDDLASHRFENPRGIRRHKIQAKSSVSSFIHLSRKEGVDVKSLPFVKKLYDHQPHEIFVELDELVQGPTHQDLEWRETARWIKYEENVEEGAERWGKPHVASLSFHSLLSLRKCLEQGTVLLDLEEKDLPGIAQKVVENLVATDQLKPENQGAVLRALLLRHRHVNDRSLMFGMRRNSSVYSNLNQLVANDKSKSPKIISIGRRASYSPQETVDKSNGKHNQSTIKTVSSDTKLQPELEVLVNHAKSQDDLQKMDTSILKRIPEGAEATTVLVGALDTLQQPIIAFIRLAKGQMMPNLVEVPIPVRFIFVLLGPIHTELDYHEIGRSISTLMANHNFHEVAYKADDRKDLLCAINEFLDDSIVLPPGDWERKSLLPIQEIRKKYQEIRQRKRKEEKEKEPTKFSSYDPLQRSRRCFGGVINDIKHRFPWYLSDLKDGLNGQCFAAAIFIYFAALSGAITFGGLMGDKTNNLIGVSETLIVTAASGVLYSLLAGQPMVIIGTTGPVLLFDEILFKFCNDNDIEFLPMRVWISFWVAIIATVVVALEGSALVRFFSRFTQEIFAALISLLYIYESFNKLYQVFLQHPLLSDYCNISNISNLNETSLNYTNISQNSSLRDFNVSSTKATNFTKKLAVPEMINQPNTALLSTIMMIGTFFIAHFLRHFRNSKFLGRSARRALGDFGVPIAIIIMVGLDASIKDSYTQKLSVPEGLSPSDPSQRGWLISPMGLQRPIAVWHAFAAFIAAVLIFILLFLEIQICELIINKKERKLKKGSGFHLDLILISYMEIACALLGGPWICAATVRSVSHVASLTVMSRTHAPGETPYVIEVKEQRVSNLFVSILIGVSVLMAPLLRKVPVAVLFGVFIYMGISSMSGIQLFERIQLLFMPVKHHPEAPYVQKVPTIKMHLYTVIQLISLAVLWIVKSTAAALAFPFVLLMMVPIRSQLKCCFTVKELHALDGEEIDDEQHEEPDFYEQILP
ncbi:band 3 anion transport protein-like [Centruroides vittatus]|uniref:band 3 anion transport protein-like n=1 Tax=Centruroides vittatus TaxID=120091 RepID=UPI00350FA7FA